MVHARAIGEPMDMVFLLENNAPATGDKGEDDAGDTMLTCDGVNVDTICNDHCDICLTEPCAFVQHGDSLVAFDEVEHGTLAPEDVSADDIPRKKSGGSPMGARVSKQLPECCVKHTHRDFSWGAELSSVEGIW
jgi:hypothetical protein